MADKKTQFSSGVDRARSRIERAVGHLESALSARADARNAAAEGVSAELTEARQESTRLKTAHQTVSKRLDSTIARIKSALKD